MHTQTKIYKGQMSRANSKAYIALCTTIHIQLKSEMATRKADLATIQEVEREILRLQELGKVSVLFSTDEGEDLRDAVSDIFMNSILDSNSTHLAHSLILLLEKHDIDASTIDANVEVSNDDIFPRSILFYACEQGNRTMIRLLSEKLFEFRYKLHHTNPQESLDLVKLAKENLERFSGPKKNPRKKNKTKRRRNKAKSKSAKSKKRKMPEEELGTDL